jgi:hypothetical protein
VREVTNCGCTYRERFLTDGREVSEHLRDVGQSELDRVLRACVQVADLTYQSETHFRAADRRRELQVEPEREAAELRRARRLNDAALGLLKNEVPAAVSELRQRLRSVGQGDIEPYVEVFTDMTTAKLVDTGWNVYHVREGRQILAQAIDAGRQGGDAVCDRFLETSLQLVELRERRDRHNDPTAAVLAALLAAAAVAFMAWAASPGGPGATDWRVLSVFGILLAMAAGLALTSLSFLVWA